MEALAPAVQTPPSSQPPADNSSLSSRVRRLFNFKLFPLITTGCKMVQLLRKPRGARTSSRSAIGTLFGCRRGKVSLAFQEGPKCMPMFILELPMTGTALLKEMGSGLVRIALECETNTHKKNLLEEMVWAVYCNGRKTGYSMKKHISEEEMNVMNMLRGTSMGTGVLPCRQPNRETPDGELTYMRARFERVIGSKDSEAFYIVNPGGDSGNDLSIFFVRIYHSAV